jgi:hypothetical protein
MRIPVLPAVSRKVLACLETREGDLILRGGAQLHPDGSGFFIAELGVDLRQVPCEEGVLRTVTGEAIRVRELRMEFATSALPKRYTFSHLQKTSIPKAGRVTVHA